MQGTPLTRSEIMALLRHEILRLESLGAERSEAIRMIARKHRVPVERVTGLVFPGSVQGGEA
jgi:hypothetical protein